MMNVGHFDDGCKWILDNRLNNPNPTQQDHEHMLNFLRNNEFDVAIRRLPELQFHAKRASLPSLSTTPIRQPTRFNPVSITGDRVEYGDFSVTFLVDENLKNYEKIFDWIHGYAFPQSHNQFKDISESEDGIYSDISLIVKNSHTNPIINFTFKNCFPTNLSEISLDTSAGNETPECTVTFAYDSFDKKRIL
jgi:hypothetical protein